jgi:FAD/FMN-containing dehydrogenase
MIANNSSGPGRVLYGKTIDHVLELRACMSGRAWRPMRAC